MRIVTYFPQLEDVKVALSILKDIVAETPLILNLNASKEHGANIYLKREDLQVVRSYNKRGAYNKISSLTQTELENGVVCASAGNHAQGVAFSCKYKKIKGVIFMPLPTPQQKIDQVRMFGEDYVQIELVGDTFDDAQEAAKEFCNSNQMTFIPPFDGEKVKDYDSDKCLKVFRATIYSFRNGVSQKATPGWTITDVEDIDWLGELFEQEINLTDL